MARSVLLRQRIRPRRRRFASPNLIHFSGSLALVEGANTVSIAAREKFRAASSALTQQSATLSISGRELFSEYLSLTAQANLVLIDGVEITAIYPGRAVIGDAAQGGLLGLSDGATYGLAATDAALYDVHIGENV